MGKPETNLDFYITSEVVTEAICYCAVVIEIVQCDGII